MKTKVLGILIISLALLAESGFLFAQENCALNLKKAQDLFSTGQVEEIPALIEPCLQSGFTKEEKILAFKVLINAYIFDDNLEKAESFMFSFLKKYPEYVVISTDPSEFVNLMQQFDNRIRFSIGIIAGGTYSVVRSFEPVNTSRLADNYGFYNTSGISYHGGLTIIKNLSDKIEISVDADYKNTVFDHYINPDAYTANDYYESQQMVNLPVTVSYTFGERKYLPYARLGFNTSLLLVSGADLITVPGTQSPRISNIDSRQKIGYYGVLGGGVKWKISKGYLFFDLRYNLALNNQVNNTGRSQTQADQLWLYQYRDDNFYHDDINFSLGYVRSIYKPRKK
ncbi:MAG: hypothetical protein H6538_03170 [Bacteroidales bacterium]|nr:hypothetical protein [Bacteroidales bacterium]MCB9000240.1 hypothetical protein [Bacteroidales bacterium]MCB9013359.1 hypothetical protein [Bacteroidales bacterium]